MDFASLCREEKVFTKIFETADEGAEHIAKEVVDYIKRTVRQKEKAESGINVP